MENRSNRYSTWILVAPLGILVRKVAFPAPHYRKIAEKHGLDVVPIYLIRKYSRIRDRVLFFMFPPIEYGDSLILNDSSMMKPERVFSVDLNTLLLSGQQILKSYEE